MSEPTRVEDIFLAALQRGETPEGIVAAYRSVELADVYAVLGRYLKDPAPFREYLRRCDEEAGAVRRDVQARQPGGPTREELTARDRDRGLVP